MRGKTKAVVLAGALLAGLMAGTQAQETRQIKVIEDRDQVKMTSKAYELKHTVVNDVSPFIIGAVKRYYSGSSVGTLNYKKDKDKKQIITVNMPVTLVPYIDDMVAKLDRQAAEKPAGEMINGIPHKYLGTEWPGSVDYPLSVVNGTGITRYVYQPKHRSASDLTMVGAIKGSGDGTYFSDSVNNIYYWKDAKSDGDTVKKWLEIFDRPVPQMELTLNVYEVNDNDVKELGIDYISWKNGPGANIFNANWDFFNMKYFNNMSSATQGLDIIADAAHSWGGFMVAPQIDASFIRILAQKGKAKIATTGALLVVIDYLHDPGVNHFSAAKYKIRFTPNAQNIQKDSNQNVSIATAQTDFYFYLRKPTINFFGEKSEQATAMDFGWELYIVDSVEKIFNGTPVQNTYTMRSWLTLAAGTEKIIGTYSKDHEVGQDNGIPLLGEIPGLKYLFGATNKSKTTTKVFVTVSAKPVTPSSELSEWAGKAVTIADALKKEENK